MSRPNHPPVVLVEWRDAASAADRWTDRAEAVENALRYATDPIIAAGFLLADAKDTIVLALLLNHHSDDAGHVMAIPKGMVTRLTTLRPAKGWDAE